MQKSKISIDTLEGIFAETSDLSRFVILLIAGLTSALSFAPLYIFPTYVIALPTLLLMVMVSVSPWQAFKCGYVFGFGHFFAGLYWIGNSFAVEPAVPDWAGYFMVALLALCLAIFIGVVGYSVGWLHRRHSVKTHLLNITVTFVVIWIMAEWLRSVIFTGFPWNLSGYIWGFSDVLLQSTAVWGIHGSGLIVVFLCFVPFLALEKKYLIISPLCGFAVIAALYAYGTNRLPDEIKFVENVNLRVVQANIKQQDKWAYDKWASNLINYMNMSEGKDNNGITHVIWPETAVIYSLSEEPIRRQLLSQVLEDGGNILTGFPRRKRDGGKTTLYNSMVAINDMGEVSGIYDKSHLVPFGEYIPAFLRNMLIPFGLDRLFTGGQDFSPGVGLRTLNIEGLPPVGVLICYEVIFPGQVVDQENRPDWLLNITNDAWYGDSTGPHQHLLQTRVRALEEGLPLVRSAGTGISAVIDPFGRIIAELSLNKRGVINSKLPTKIEAPTPYSLYREWTLVLLIVILITANIVSIRRSYR